MRLTNVKSSYQEEIERAVEHIKRCDRIFDGENDDGTPMTIGPDKEFAYNEVRLLAFELLDILEGISE